MQKLGSALRLPKFLLTVIVSPGTADAWRQRLDVRDPGKENDDGGEGLGLRAGGGATEKKEGEGSLPEVLVINRMRIYISRRKSKEVGRQMTCQEYRLGNKLHIEAYSSTPYIFPRRPPFRSIFLDVLYAKAVITQVRSTYMRVLYMRRLS